LKEIIIFDLDGVLVDSVERSLAALCGIISRHGLDPNYDFIIRNWGHSFEGILIPLLAEVGNWPEYKKILVLQEANDFFEHVTFKEFINLEEKLIALKELGHGLGVITNRSLKSMEKALFDLNIEKSLFDFLHSADSGICKPNPQVFEHVFRYHPSSKVTFVGDSIICDLPAARNCQPKVDFVGITSIIHNKEDFVIAGVPEHMIYDSVVDFMTEIIA
jgi:phosphoglycolate phosphatase-like HAD superfamily hydrolase